MNKTFRGVVAAPTTREDPNKHKILAINFILVLVKWDATKLGVYPARL